MDTTDTSLTSINRINDAQKKLLQLMTKYFVVSLIAVISSQILSLIFCIDKDTTFIINCIEWLLFSIDCTINTVCLYLIFAVNDI